MSDGRLLATAAPSRAPFAHLLKVPDPVPPQRRQASLDMAVAVAQRWLALCDVPRADAMWMEAGVLMRQRVPRAEWVAYLRRIRLDRGPLLRRQWFEVVRVGDPEGLPPGDYLNVTFQAAFERARQVETVSLAPAGASWHAVGYLVRPRT